MCGIFAILNNRDAFSQDMIIKAFNKGKNRGPESSSLQRIGEKAHFGFHRLAINGLTEESGQPMTIDGITLICNGEIYNYHQLFTMLDITPITESDCEIIIHLYKRYGIEETLSLLDGVFAFALYDYSDYQKGAHIHIARDPLGVRPLYYLSPNGRAYEDREANMINVIHDDIKVFASELKVLQSLLNESDKDIYYDSFRPNSLTRAQNLPIPTSTRALLMAKQFPPGTYSSYCLSKKVHATWEEITKHKHYTCLNISSTSLEIEHESVGRSTHEEAIWKALCNAVCKRVVGTTQRDIACCLSGGLDSSLIAALVNEYYDGTLETYSIGMHGSDDLKYARKVADYLGTQHREIILTDEEFWNAIPEVIHAIESYDTTTVRASVGNYLVGKYISQHSNAKVVFNGDGSDELTGGYLYMLAAPDSLEFNAECRRLLNNIHAFDVLRSDKCISSHGLEPRTPFLDKSFVSTYMNAPVSLRNPRFDSKDKPEKYLLRTIVEKMHPTLLPHEVLWRTKEAFSDGVSKQTKSWFEIIQDHIKSNLYDHLSERVEKNILNNMNPFKHNKPETLEQMHYREIFSRHFKSQSCQEIIPYFWMPKFIEATDASARTLKIYNEINNN